MTGPRRRDPDQTGDTPTKLSLAPPVKAAASLAIGAMRHASRLWLRLRVSGDTSRQPRARHGHLSMHSRLGICRCGVAVGLRAV